MANRAAENADRLARSVLKDRLHLKAKENVTIETYPSALPWATGFVREARRMGAKPLLHYEDEASYWTAVEEGHAHRIGSPSDAEWAALADTDVYIYFWGPEDMARRLALPEKTQGSLTAFNGKWYDVAAKAGLRGARMSIARVTERNARHWGVSRSTWEAEVLAASFRDPKTMAKDAAKVERAFARGHELRVRHPNGTDLRLALAGYPVHVTTGEVTPAEMKSRFGRMANVPDGTVFVAIDESTADGEFVANRMTTASGAPQVGGRYSLTDGALTRASFSKGGGEFRSAYAEAGAGKDHPSFIEVGLQPDVGNAPGLEELERGAVTFGIGGNSGFGGKGKADFLHYLTLGGAELSVDGRTLVKGGRIR